MSTHFDAIDKVREELVSLAERLKSLVRGMVGEEKKEVSEGASGPVEATEQVAEMVGVSRESVESNGEANATEKKKASQSDLIRKFLKDHGGVRNRDIIESIRKDHGVEVNPSLVSYLRHSSAGKKEKKVSRMKIHEASRKQVAKTKEMRSGSSLIREYLERHPNASNEEIVKELKKGKRIEVKPTLVSSVRAILKRQDSGTSKVYEKTKKSLPMTTIVVKVLERAPRDGIKLSEIAKKSIDAGYEYRGSKGKAGVTQNVYQALHALSRQVPHQGYEGKDPVVIHDGMRWRLNPRAKKKIA